MQPISTISVDALTSFFEMLQKPPAEDVEKGTAVAKARLCLNASTGDIAWLQPAREKKVWNITQFDLVLRAVVGKIEAAKRTWENLPNVQSREALQRLLPQVKQTLSEKLTRFDRVHNRWFSCYYWRGLHSEALALQGELNREISELSARVAQLPLTAIPPPPPMVKGLKKSAAKQQPAAAEVLPVDATPTEAPAQPAQRPRAKSDAPQYVPKAGDIGQARLKPTNKMKK